MLAETIIPVAKLSSKDPDAEQDKFKFIQLLFDDPIYEVFEGAADELKVDPANPADGDFLKVVCKCAVLFTPLPEGNPIQLIVFCL